MKENILYEEFSASDLVKMTCYELAHNRIKKLERQVSDLMMEGNQYALDNTISDYIEMQGNFCSSKGSPIKIHFIVDEIRLIKKRAELIEHKMVKFEPNKFFFQKSLAQTAFYKSLTVYSNKKFVTADFFEGPKNELDLSEYSLFSRLNFGGNWYGIDCDFKEIMKYYVHKARSALQYEKAKAFDKVHKKSLWKDIGPFIKVHKLNG